MLLTFFLYFGAISAAPSIHFREYHKKNDGFTIENREAAYYLRTEKAANGASNCGVFFGNCGKECNGGWSASCSTVNRQINVGKSLCKCSGVDPSKVVPTTSTEKFYLRTNEAAKGATSCTDFFKNCGKLCQGGSNARCGTSGESISLARSVCKCKGVYRAPESLREFRINMLNRHNELRAKHRNTGSLTMDDGINTIAQNYAEELAAKGIFKHSRRPGYGENLYRSSGDLAFGAASTDAWYNEICDYTFEHPSHNPENKMIGHFTQVVWKDTTSIGIGRATSIHGTYVVANYIPQGNYVDYETMKPGKQYIENVHPTLYDRDQYCSQL